MVTFFASDGLPKKHFGEYALLKIFSSDHQAAAEQTRRTFSSVLMLTDGDARRL